MLLNIKKGKIRSKIKAAIAAFFNNRRIVLKSHFNQWLFYYIKTGKNRSLGSHSFDKHTQSAHRHALGIGVF
jgi:hypothetical protein